MTAYDKFINAIERDQKGEMHLSHAFFTFGRYRIQILGRYWFWVDDELSNEWEYGADSWEEMLALDVEQIGMTLCEALRHVNAEDLEFE